MPEWDIHLSYPVLSQEEKQDLAKKITSIYVAAGLPPFYVQVRFHQVDAGAYFVGGEERNNFVGISMNHIARQLQDPEAKKRFLDKVDSILTPVFKAKGLDWEYFVTESPRDLWKINGLYPPESYSEDEVKWQELNRPVERL